MSSPDAVVRRWFEEVWNKRREYSDRRDDAGRRDHPWSRPAAAARQHGLQAVLSLVLEAFTDLKVDVLRTVTQGDIVATHIHATGRHSGPGMGTPTNNVVAFDGMIITRVRGEQIVEGWNCIDFLTMYQQMGWVAAPVQPL